MEISVTKRASGKIQWIVIAIVLLAAIATLITVIVQQNQSGQALESTLTAISFCGEYKIADGEWKPISEGKHISATKGTVQLRGAFVAYDANTGEALGNVESGTVLYLYLDHLRATIKDSDGNVWYSENETEALGKMGCAEAWSAYEFVGQQDGEVTITLYNPHFFGNGRSVDSFLNKLQIYGGEGNDPIADNAAVVQVAIALLLLVFFLVLLGVAIVSSALHIRYEREIWLVWLLVLFGGIYFVFSSSRIGIWSELYALNTIMLGFSMMLYFVVVSAIVVNLLGGRLRMISNAMMFLLGAVTLVAMLASTVNTVKFYDVYTFWLPVAVAVAVLLAVCVVIDMTRRTDTEADKMTSQGRKYIGISVITVLSAFIIDSVATVLELWQGGVLSIFVLLLLVFISIVIIVRVVPKSIRTILDAKEIEAERQAMETKLQESRISIMLSQIQPHFLYNTLNSIYQLCETNPMLARSMVNSFSEYLRNNLSSLDEPGLVPFDTELSHIKTYLDIEKIRFDDTLEVEYDVKQSDFYLPVLTVQPIVENAVKHGTSKKRGGGKVVISTAEDAESYIITVSDTGSGFDPLKEKNDGKRHVGIENVRQRLANMCNGVLTIESEIGVGTVATIRIPKEGMV